VADNTADVILSNCVINLAPGLLLQGYPMTEEPDSTIRAYPWLYFF